ncbi:tyrosine-protein phosphatase [Krasilnikoviella flava]|uniref:Protein-tyrosine phosphatase n=1 Tax=Krasilnikoviella flava TaxID=526729 RepID=A0A1T5LIZ0_9MICO|nr:tyrosine-protein phosphatase [Krasilnikoviella flava]SKC75942.1 protein-tyrosine phosphatase [Krasilnikoviella flava]
MNRLTRCVATSVLVAGLAAAPVAASIAAPHTTAATTGRHAVAAHGAIPFTAATVTAEDDGSFTVTWSAPRGAGDVRLYTGTSRDRIDTRHVVARGDSSGTVTVRGLQDADRRWFRLVPERGQGLTLADRLVQLDGTVNLRDMGGYRTVTGQWVAMGEAYRSDALDRLSEDDLDALEALDVRTVVDLRTESERTTAPDRVPEGARYEVADVIGGGGATVPDLSTPEAAAQMMVDGERSMVSSDTGRAAYETLFDAVDDKGAVLFHCTAGKDRTGWAAAALLTTAGVPRDVVEDDYLLSNDYRAEANAAALASMPAEQAAIYKPLMDVRPEYLAAGFDEVRDEYRSFGGYLRQGLGLSPREIRDVREELLVG